MKMIKHILLSIAFISLSISVGYANDLIGTYTTKPEIFPGFHKPYSEKVKEGIKTLTWKMKITEKDIIIEIRDEQEPIVMQYEIQGKYLLGRENDAEIRKYVPFYIEDSNTIHGFNTIFFRTDEKYNK